MLDTTSRSRDHKFPFIVQDRVSGLPVRWGFIASCSAKLLLRKKSADDWEVLHVPFGSSEVNGIFSWVDLDTRCEFFSTTTSTFPSVVESGNIGKPVERAAALVLAGHDILVVCEHGRTKCVYVCSAVGVCSILTLLPLTVRAVAFLLLVFFKLITTDSSCDWLRRQMDGSRSPDTVYGLVDALEVIFSVGRLGVGSDWRDANALDNAGNLRNTIELEEMRKPMMTDAVSHAVRISCAQMLGFPRPKSRNQEGAHSKVRRREERSKWLSKLDPLVDWPSV